MCTWHNPNELSARDGPAVAAMSSMVGCWVRQPPGIGMLIGCHGSHQDRSRLATVRAVPRAVNHFDAPVEHLHVRRHNLSLVLRLLAAQGPRSRAGVAATTGLTRATVSSLVADLIDRGLVKEVGPASDQGVGRPATLLQLDGSRVITLGLELEVHGDLTGEVEAREHGLELAGVVELGELAAGIDEMKRRAPSGGHHRCRAGHRRCRARGGGAGAQPRLARRAVAAASDRRARRRSVGRPRQRSEPGRLGRVPGRGSCRNATPGLRAGRQRRRGGCSARAAARVAGRPPSVCARCCTTRCRISPPG